VTGSTNDDARALAIAGVPHGAIVLAEEQTSGRGRQGRVWSSPRGRALTLSVVLRAEPGSLELLPLTAAVAVCEACELAAPVHCAVKWPNDVWIEERKVAGILIESRPREGWAVVGIGLNVDTALDELAPELREGATSLRIAAGSPVDREQVLEALLARLAARAVPSGEGGGDAVLSALRERDALNGRRIAWATAGRRLEGEARGINDEGRLVVFDDRGERHALDAGEVHLLT
jgi:BirA family transcriptional regulator, biotin operon repressor / biotin---[acetyl-CoA-carboxylase] ligase